MKSRTEELRNIEEKSFDLCVIGGGATGSGCALDAQLRALQTVMLDAGDFAGETSSKATKVIHGGVRYLEEAVKEMDPKEYHVLIRALHERVHMLENAPHLTEKVEFLVPCFHWIDVAYLDVGLKLYDWLATTGRISPSRFVSREETLQRLPAVKNKGLVGAVAYSDGKFDDARYNVTLVQTFTQAGGSALNYARVVDFSRDADGKLSGVSVKDQMSGRTFPVHAKAFVNATGPFSDSIRQLATPSVPARMRLSKGAHILLPMELFPTRDAMLIPKTEDGRVLFAIPWGGRLLVGTTEEEVSAQDELVLTRLDVAYILGQLNQYLAHPVTPDQIVSGFAGARPLVSSGASQETKKLARDDVIENDPQSGLISIMGGKWTTHRAMAENTIGAVEQYLGISPATSSTRNHILYGGEGYTTEYWKQLAQEYGLSEETARHLASKFGTATPKVMELTRENPALAKPLLDGRPPIQAEVVYTVRNELAATIEDVLSRRLGVQLYSWRDAIHAAPVTGSLMAKELQWSKEQAESAINAYVAKINRLLQVAGLPQESTTDAEGGRTATA